MGLLVAAFVASCGGGDADERATSSAERKARSLGVPAGSSIPADAATKGMWSQVYNWPLIAIHAVLLPDGRVLSYGSDGAGRQTGNFIYDLWDTQQLPDAGHLTLPNGTGTDIFCGSQVLLPQAGSGAVFLAGGDNWTGTATTNTGNRNTNLLDVAASTLARGDDLNRQRWYSSSVMLSSGEVFIQGGTGGTDRAEVRNLDGSFRLFPSDVSALHWYYPRNFVQPDGRVFGFDTYGQMYFIDVAAQTLSPSTTLPTTAVGITSSAAMFRPGRILQLSGASGSATVIDVNGVVPLVTPTQPLSSARNWVNATILPNGKVLATGGERGGGSVSGANNKAEIWDPQTGIWAQGASGVRARMYHSTALLLPDASVLVAGGGAPGSQTNLNAEIYYPPYLFTADGREAQRPAVTVAPSTLEVGKVFELEVADAASIERVVLIKSGSVTHSFNMDQRFSELVFSRVGAKLAVQAPARAGEATPGYYLLFVIDAAGVPSVAKTVYVPIAAQAEPGTVPVLQAIGNQHSTLGQAVDLPLQASDPNGDTLRFSATGLPSGLTLDAVTGRISGQPDAVGDYEVAIGVSDGLNTVSLNLLWAVTAQAPPVIDAISVPTAVPSNSAVQFSASASGANLRYQWIFGDGTVPTDWATDAGAAHVYAAPGVYFVSLIVEDGYGTRQTRTFMQSVYRPATATQPTASSALLAEQGSGAVRIWAVNPDNDSVGVLDAASGTRIAEIKVGVSPRSIARAPDGLLWVSNRDSATISVISPTTLTVVRTIALPRASQPVGIAMSPVRNEAFIVLEAGRNLLRYSTTSYAQTGTLFIGLHGRQVSISGDGARVYVARFITAPLPGEATAVVTPTASTGGEVLQVDAQTMLLTRTIVLGHSDRPDAENQGRGIPNYLGAPVISPDGSQAFVPSKQDNVQRGGLRDGNPLDFQNTVRAISSRIDLSTGLEDAASRIDHDNASVASAALFDPRGIYLFVALETSREIAVVDAHARRELLRVDAGQAPQALALSPDGRRLYASNFMDRSVGIYDLDPLLGAGELRLPLLASPRTLGVEKLSAQVLRGKQLFYDARDPRLARDRYLSCASCHNDGGHDGRVWDMSASGEGLRNTISLRGKAGGQGHRHWSANFDETQDFEGQIRALAGGTGLMDDDRFNAGTRSQPLGDKKASQSADLDAMAAYVASLSVTPQSTYRSTTGANTSAGLRGLELFKSRNCASCHAGAAFTGSGTATLIDIGTLKPSSGQRLGAALTGIDVPTLRDLWATAPYLHDGSAPTLSDAVRAHAGHGLSATQVDDLSKYLREIGSEEVNAAQLPGAGLGLAASYFASTNLSGTPVLSRVESVNFAWGTAAPGTSVPASAFSVRWTGLMEAPASGTYRLRTTADDGVRLWIDDVQLINKWTARGLTTDTATGINLTAGQKVRVRMEYFVVSGKAEARLYWSTPGNAGLYYAVPKSRSFAE